MSTEMLEKIMDHSSDEIYVLDGQTRIVFVNKVFERHYGLKRSEVIGKYNEELFQLGYWTPSIVPIVLKEKKPVTIKQTTFYGGELITTAVPLLNRKQEIELIVCTGHEQNYKQLTLLKEKEPDEIGSSKLFDSNMITNCETMKKLIQFCRRIASVDSTILIQGESGTGKGVLAKYIHQMSQRKNGPFLTINCAAIPEELLESELFGYSQGAFTGANKNGKTGLIEAADHGTLFLDEIGEISPKIQAKLLQVIQERQFLPIGSREVKRVDIRIIAATNRNLFEMVEKKLFREDLYYRLNVIDIKVPPLRERTGDIVLLTYYFLNKFNRKYGVERLISQECLDLISGYSWPGNVRQLENVMERLVVTAESMIDAKDLPDIVYQNAKQNVTASAPSSLDAAIEQVERTLIVRSYHKNGSSRKVAQDLNISQTRASKLIRKYCQNMTDADR
jgi:transcriptional regulator with PAS, ATPase and Fis domain